MQPRVLLTALALVVFLIVGALMILGDPESPVFPDAPTVLPETPVNVEVLPEITVDRVRDPELPEISAAGRGVITGSVFSGADSTLPADLMVKLVRFDWPGRFADQARIDATQLVTLEGGFGLQDDLPLIRELRGIISEIDRRPCESDGSFRFDGLAAGSYLVCAAGPDSIWSPATERSVLGDRTGWESECEIPLQPTRSVTVQVLSDGRAVADAWVGLRGEIVDRAALPDSLNLPVEEVWLYLLNDPFVSARTDAKGLVAFPVLPAIPYLIFARKDGVGTGESHTSREESRLQRVELIQGGTVSGIVMGYDDQVVAGAEIELSYDGNINTEYFVPGVEGVSAEDGTFTFTDLKPGTYEMKVGLSGYQTRRLDDLIVNPAQELFEEVLLLKGHRISGTVVDPLGDPVVGVDVRLRPDRGPAVPTDLEGRFEFDTLDPRTYRVLVESPCVLRSSTETPVDAEPLVIVVEDGGVVSGRFVDSQGTPVPGVKVQVSDRARSEVRDQYSSAVSGLDGTFSVCSEVVSDSETPLVLFAFPPVHEKLILDLQQGLGDVGDLMLSPASRIFGITRAPDGTPLAGVALEFTSGERPEWDPTGNMKRQSFSDSEGFYEFHLPVSSRSWTLAADHPDFTASEPIEIPAGEAGRSIPVDVVLTKGASLEVVVTTSGEPVQGATVELSRNRGWNFVRKVGVTDERGECRFSGLGDSDLSIKVTKTGFGSALTGVELLKDGEHRVEVSLDSPISFSGWVLCEGIPVAGAVVSIRDVSRTERQGVTDSRGEFRVESLAAGALRVDVRADGYQFRRVEGVDPRESPLTITVDKTHDLTGYLFDGASREPVSNALVRVTAVNESGQSIRGGRRIRSRRSDEEGVFVSPDLRPGFYKVQITSPDHLPLEQILSVPTVPEVVEFPLQRGERIYLQVTNENGLPLDGVRVRPDVRKDRQRNRGEWVSLPTSRRLETDSNGELSIGGLQEGPHRLRLSKYGYLPKREVVDVGISTRSEVQRYVLIRGGYIRGTVYLTDGEVATRQKMICTGVDETGKEYEETLSTNREGFFRFGPFPTGEFTIGVPAGDGGTSPGLGIRLLSNGAPVSVQLMAPEDVEVDLQVFPQ